MEKFKCHDCKKLLDNGDEYIPYTVGNEVFIKCKPCYKKDSVLRNFQKTEVFSRIVGYIRPIKNWNPGKQEEFKDRRTFKIHAD
jgi:anaerobic ribonucleoside-triphosphate reductase